MRRIADIEFGQREGLPMRQHQPTTLEMVGLCTDKVAIRVAARDDMTLFLVSVPWYLPFCDCFGLQRVKQRAELCGLTTF